MQREKAFGSAALKNLRSTIDNRRIDRGSDEQTPENSFSQSLSLVMVYLFSMMKKKKKEDF